MASLIARVVPEPGTYAMFAAGLARRQSVSTLQA
jgi:hypothetical protein